MGKKFPSFKNKNVLILGLGLLGRGLKDAIFFAEEGAKVTVTDLKSEKELANSLRELKPYKNIKYTLGKHEESDILEADLIMRNPAVPLDSPIMKFARKHKKKVDMDESLFAEYCPCKIVGITGTRGKSTTTTLIGKLLTKYYDKGKVYLAGNLQGEATLPLIKKVTKDDVVVLELSSWQLQGFGWKKISPYISVFTNIYEDHLNRYSNMKDYIADKKIIYKYQKKSDFCILGERNKHTKALGKEVKSQLIWFSDSDVPKKWKIKMLGKHNQANIAAAMNVGEIFGLSLAQMETVLANYPGLEHRLEFVRKVNNITFINDTTSTTPISGMKALEAIETPIVLLAGGATKQLEMRPFAEAIAKKVKFVILLEGSATDELERIIKAAGGSNLISGRYDDFEEAIKHAYGVCLPGDTLLLSPGCASFGMFINEFDRGERFKRIVSHLK